MANPGWAQPKTLPNHAFVSNTTPPPFPLSLCEIFGLGFDFTHGKISTQFGRTGSLIVSVYEEILWSFN
jgi:hypothetical protein